MSNSEYNQVKQQIQNHTPITQQTLDKLKALKTQYDTHITQCTVQGRIEEAMFFKTDQLEILGLINQAILV